MTCCPACRVPLRTLPQQPVRPEDVGTLQPLVDQGRIRILDLGVGTDPDPFFLNLRSTYWEKDRRRDWILAKEFRKAISHAVDREVYANTVYLGAGVPVWGPVTPGNKEWFSPNVMRYGHSIDRAREILAGLGLANRDGDEWLEDRNNTEARFLVGSQRPFVQISRVQPTDQATRDQVVQYKDVGTKLTVRPTINQDRYVSLLIQQEINQATSETQFDAPIISTREARTQVLVRDGQTIVIGGLRDHVKEKSQSGVPILSGIPIIGGLFGSATRRSTETELYLFLTPRIIATDAEADSVTTPRLPEDLE